MHVLMSEVPARCLSIHQSDESSGCCLRVSLLASLTRSHGAVVMSTLDLDDRGIGLWLDESLENGPHACITS